MTNMHDWARSQETLVEVIYPSMDGYVYFLELETGKETRDPLYMGLTYKGTGEFVEKDEAARKVVLLAKAKDSRGNGTVDATTVRFRPVSSAIAADPGTSWAPQTSSPNPVPPAAPAATVRLPPTRGWPRSPGSSPARCARC